LTSRDSPIIDFYPLKFEIDLEGKRQEWEGRPILPFIDVDRLKKAYSTIENELTEAEKKRTQPGKNVKYFNNCGIVRTTFF
jgi:5'-3' exonuclease